MRTKLFQRVATGRHRDGACANGFSAGDVVRCVADDEHLVRDKFPSMVGGGTAQRMWPELVAIFRIVGKSAERESRPETEMAEFDLRANLQVARQQALCDVRPASDVVDDFGDTGQHASPRIVHFVGQTFQVSIEKALDICGRGAAEMMFQNRARDPQICASKVFEPGEIVVDAELAFEREFEASFAGAAGVDQGAVDIPEQKCLHVKNFILAARSMACEPKLPR